MTGNGRKSYLGHLNQLVDKYNIYHGSIGKKPIHADYYALTEEIESGLKAPKFKVGDSVRITRYKNSFSKGYTNS